jgi:hypothetical protein
MLYEQINFLGGVIWRTNHDLADGRIPESAASDLPNLQAKIEDRVDQTVRFGVETPRIEGQGATPEYWAWFRKWDGWVKGLSDAEYRALEQRVIAGEGTEIHPSTETVP